MLPFRIHQLEIGRLHYLLLPKLTRWQMRVISERLTEAGYSVELSDHLSARSAHASIRVDASGVCRATTDVGDLLIPAVPDILASRKARIPMSELESLYLAGGRFGRKTTIRVFTRVESGRLWDLMRASESCGLTPDEHAVTSFLLERSHGACEVLTDFPTHESVVRVLRGRRYYNSRVYAATASMTLRAAGARSPRNSYLRRDGVLKVDNLRRPSASDWRCLFNELGEWCYFAPE